jgi:integrase
MSQDYADAFNARSQQKNGGKVMARRGQNEGSIFERKDGRWAAQVNLGWINGKRARKMFYGATRKDVQSKLNTALSNIDKGLPILSEKQTVDQYLNWWLQHVAKPTVRPATFTSYDELVRLHLGPAFKAVPLSKLAPQHVRGFMTDKLNAGLSTRRVQYLHAVLRAALNTAMKDQIVIRNAAALVKPPRVVEKEVQPLTPDEARKLLKAIKGHRLEGLFAVALALGLRQGEALGLRWRDVDFDAGKLRIRFALQRLKTRENGVTKSAFHLVEPKTKQSRRTISMPAVTLSALADHRARQLEERNLAGAAWKTPALNCGGELLPVDDLVFVTSVGTPFDAPTVTHRFQAVLKLAQISHHRFHDLRHTAATLLSVQGVHPRAIQAALGWENLSMLNRYSHFVEEQRQAVASAMESILNPVAVKVAVSPTEEKPN